MTRKIGAARVHEDKLGALLDRVLDEGGGNRVIDDWIRADDDDELCVVHLCELV
jgi:hypothetical protein